MHNTSLPMGSKLIDIPLAADERGALNFATAGREIPFPVARVFWIHDIPAFARRGGHSHRTCSEVVVAVGGAFTMTVSDGATRAQVRLSSPSQGLLIPAGLWCELSDFEEGTVVVVMASEAYDAKGYCHDYTSYKEERGVKG